MLAFYKQQRRPFSLRSKLRTALIILTLFPAQPTAANGITKGTGANAFSPDATCTRAQAVTLIYRAQ